MLYRLKPVTPLTPKALKMKPPTIAPTIPRTISRKNPSPDLLTILLAMKPAMRPSKIQPDDRHQIPLLLREVPGWEADNYIISTRGGVPLSRMRLTPPITSASPHSRIGPVPHQRLSPTPSRPLPR
jgi:hypothetical protein